MSAIVSAQQLDGQWVEMPTLDDPVCSSDDWGHLSCTFTVATAQVLDSLLTADTPLSIEEEGTPIFEGVIEETPEEDEGGVVSVQGVGDQVGFDDDLIFRWWVHSRLDDWQDIRSLPGVPLAQLFAAAQVQADAGLVIQMATGDVWPGTGHAGFTLDLGDSSNGPLRVVLSYAFSNNEPGLRLYVRASDQPHPVTPPAGTFEDAVSAVTPGATGTVRGNFTGRRRYLHVFLWRATTSAAYGADVWFVISKLIAFRDLAWESGDTSILKTSDLVKDVLPFVPLLSQDTREIEATGLSLPEAITADSSMSPRQIVEQWNAPHDFQARVRPKTKRIQFRARPTVPKYKVGAWANKAFRQTAISARDDLFNHVIVTGQDGTGQPVRVERHAAQLPGMAGERISSPAFTNPSFATDLSGWTALSGSSLSRDTTTFDTAPASLRIDGSDGDGVRGAMTGTFKKTTPHRVSIVMQGVVDFVAVMRLGTADDFGTATLRVPGSWTVISVVWVPRSDASAGVNLDIRFVSTLAFGEVFLSMRLDSGILEIVRPTLLDRRGRLRSTEIQVGGTLDIPTANQLSDAFLIQSLTTPLQGKLPVAPGEVLDYLTDEPVHPREMVNNTGELVHFGDMVDPNTGAHGRDGRIVTVNDYDSGTGKAELEITESRTSFERLLAKHDLTA